VNERVHGEEIQVQTVLSPVPARRGEFFRRRESCASGLAHEAKGTNEASILRKLGFRLLFYCEKAGCTSTNSFMPHGSSSCRRRVSTLLRSELESLYARRSALNATIQALECYQAGIATPQPPRYQGGLEIKPKPCNLTTCRNA
jgi:hypothetical protein